MCRVLSSILQGFYQRRWHSLLTHIEPTTARMIGTRKSWSIRVNSATSTIAVNGMLMLAARNAAAPMIANAVGRF